MIAEAIVGYVIGVIVILATGSPKRARPQPLRRVFAAVGVWTLLIFVPSGWIWIGRRFSDHPATMFKEYFRFPMPPTVIVVRCDVSRSMDSFSLDMEFIADDSVIARILNDRQLGWRGTGHRCENGGLEFGQRSSAGVTPHDSASRTLAT